MTTSDAGSDHLSGTPAFSVVIPAHNAGATLRSCIRSVLGQTVSEFEVIVVDDGSADDTATIARSITDPRVVVRSQRQRGLPGARNAGIEMTTGEIVCFLDSDDLLLPRYLETVRDTFQARPDVDFVYTDAWTFDDTSRRVRRNTTAHYQRPPRPEPRDAAAMFGELVLRNFIIVPVAVRRDVLLAAGMFDATMTACEDWDLWLRLLLSGHRAAEAPGPLGLRREHPAQMSSDDTRMVSNAVYMLEKLARDPNLTPDARRQVHARLQSTHHTLRILTGEDPRGALRLRTKRRLGRLRRALGFGARWYRRPPAIVTAAFGDLTSLD